MKKRIGINIDVDAHANFKSKCALNRKNMNVVLNEFMANYGKESEAQNGNTEKT